MTPGRTYTENLEAFRQFIVDKVNSSKEDHERLFNECIAQMGNEAMRNEVSRYYQDSKKGGFFRNEEKLLVDALITLYKINYSAITGEEFANRLTSDPNFKKYVASIEAKNLLSGTKIYSTEVAAKEAKQLSEVIEHQRSEIKVLKADKNIISEKLEAVNRRLNNLVANLKAKLGLADDKINELMQEPEQKAKIQEQQKQDQKRTGHKL